MLSLVRTVVGVGAILAISAVSAIAETRLIMFEEEGCPWCELWREEVGIIYDKTEEGKQAPLVVLDMLKPVPAKYSLKSEPIYSPTFVLIEDGIEFGRIEGYPGDSFFWGLLGMMLKKLDHEGPDS
jgi:hypothetical protein